MLFPRLLCSTMYSVCLIKVPAQLMHDPTGQGWVKHMIHGTSRAMEAAGPVLFESGHGRDFYMQARIFEVSRAIIFQESTFLATPAWERLSGSLCGDATLSPRDPLESLMDIMSMCSELCYQSVLSFYSTRTHIYFSLLLACIGPTPRSVSSPLLSPLIHLAFS